MVIAWLRERSAIQSRKTGASLMYGLPMPIECIRVVSAIRAFSSGSLTATTLHWWRFEDVDADWAAATSVSTAPSGSGSGR